MYVLSGQSLTPAAWFMPESMPAQLVDSGISTASIVLGHLSRENNTPAAAMRAVGAALEGTGASLLCAPAFGCLEVKVEERCLA